VAEACALARAQFGISMIRKAFLMSLNPDCRAEYERRHNPIWAELQEVLKNHGVSNYSIFLEKESNQLFGYAEIESEELWVKITETDECKRWWKFMKDLMATNADNSPVSKSLEEVFHLD
jgi:L-rhamnose mutarotase